MPHVHIRITDEGATPTQKKELIRRSTEMMVEVLGKNRSTTFVTIEEVPTDNWGIGGEPVTELRKKKK